MQIQVNGENRTVKAQNVAELLEELGFKGRPVAVERNREVVPRRQQAETPLEEGDNFELVTLVGGG